MKDLERQIEKFVITQLKSNSPEISREKMEQYLQMFNPDLAEGTLSFVLPVRRLALYLLERIYYMEEILSLYNLRTRLINSINEKFENQEEILEELNLHVIITSILDRFYFSSRKTRFSYFFIYTTTFLNFFLQIANPIRRGAELTYSFIYEYTPKMETLLKMDERVNFIITKEINGIDYIQLVFDTYYKENLLNRLPYQFMKPKMAMVLSSNPEMTDFDVADFKPDFMVLIGETYNFTKSVKDAYFLNFDASDYLFLYRETRSSKIFNVEQIKY